MFAEPQKGRVDALPKVEDLGADTLHERVGADAEDAEDEPILEGLAALFVTPKAREESPHRGKLPLHRKTLLR